MIPWSENKIGIILANGKKRTGRVYWCVEEWSIVEIL